MTNNSKYFDSIRVKPTEDRSAKQNLPECDWAGCDSSGKYPAPQGRGRDGQYFKFCLKHVREYNKSYNYFQGMSDDDIAKYQKSSVTGHRPTWSVGTNPPSGEQNKDTENPTGFTHNFNTKDYYGIFGKDGESEASAGEKPRRPIRNMEKKCLIQLNLDITATKDEIKTRFKDLVKRHHPDLNRGDKRSEDKLREVIQAYNYLKKAGLC